MLYTKQHKEAVTKKINFQVKIASFYDLSAKAEYQLIHAVAKVLEEQGKSMNFIVDNVQLQSYNKDLTMSKDV